jgi:FixJ family two-component response regulator
MKSRSKLMPMALVVDDDRDVKTAICAVLARVGCTVLDAETPREALQVSDETTGPISILVMDVLLGGDEGLNLVEILVQRRAKMSCLFLSGCPTDHLYRRALLGESVFASHRFQFLQKPFTVRALFDAIGRMTEEAGSA